MSTPAIILLTLEGITLLAKARLHGRELKVSLPFALLDAATLISLLWWGGFFS